ncbi:MAG: S8 family serine peptidase [Hyphomonadaceae bacterium]|nr:S8 family serine peptidase [Hyphomonadaceae bacterium]
MSEGRAPSVGNAVRAALLASLAASTVAACAGGGGGASPPSPPSPILPPPPPPPPPPPAFPLVVAPAASFESAEYLGAGFTSSNRSGLGQLHASTAYSLGATGQGITVAVIDTNVDASISELRGQVIGSHDVRASTRSSTDIDKDGHGTMVTSVIAALKNGTGVHGVAYESKVLAIRADTPGSCQPGDAEDSCTFNDSSLIAAIDYARSNGAKIINMSLGGDGNITPALKAAIVRATDAGIVFAIAAGNDGAGPTSTEGAKGTVPGEPAIVAGDPAVNGRVVAVGAVDRNGAMPTFSNRAGSTASYYLLAPGVQVITAGVDDDVRSPGANGNDADTDGDYWAASGTSFAAPHVAGALALMLDLFPNITPENAMLALLESADDYVTSTPDAVLGVNAGVGTDAVGGRGILNLQRAFSPMGATTMNFDGEQVALSTALGPARGALGDWAEHSKAFNGLVFQDKFLRGFRLDNARMLGARPAFNDFGIRADYARGHARAAAFGNAQISWFNAPRPAYDPRMPWMEDPEPTFQLSYNLADTRVSVGRGGGPERLTPGLTLIDDPSGPATLGSGDSWTSYAQSLGPMMLDVRTFSGHTRNASSIGLGASGQDWAMRLGYAALKDTEATLGGALQSRFGGDDSTRLSAISLEARQDLGAWTVSGSLEAASARVDTLNVSGLWTSAWSLSAEHPFAGGAMRFTAGQPRRAEGGQLAFNAPIEVTKAGAIIYASRIAGLTPSGRELDLEAAWVTRLGELTMFEAAAALSSQPNHVADAKTEAALWLSLRHAW